MKHNAGSTLLTTNKLGVITETDQHYLEAVKAFARLSYESICWTIPQTIIKG